MLAALDELSRDLESAVRALKLGPSSSAEATLNQHLASAPTAPAIDRFDGVLFDALDAASLEESSRARAGERVAIASALFGLVGALDPIPAYRLSADSRLPGAPLRRRWGGAISTALDARPDLVIDLRSEAYRALGPLAPGPARVDVRVVAVGPDGAVRALNHFNKAAKGAFTRRVLESPVAPSSRADLLDWARDAGISLRPGVGEVLDLVADEALLGH